VTTCKHLQQFRGEARMSTWVTAMVIHSVSAAEGLIAVNVCPYTGSALI
jgi:hypothetical protein